MKKILILSVFICSTLCNNILSTTNKVLLQTPPRDSWKVTAVHYLPMGMVATVAGLCVAIGVALLKGVTK